MLKVTNRTTVKEIVEYAREELGIELSTEGKEKKDLIAEVRALEKDAGIEGAGGNDDDEGAGGNDGDEPVADIPMTTKAHGKNPSRVEINIHQPAAPDEDAEPDTHCELGFNGRVFQLQYGIDLIVEYGVYDVLKNAVQTKYFQKKNQQTGQTEMHSKKVQRFPFNVIRFID